MVKLPLINIVGEAGDKSPKSARINICVNEWTKYYFSKIKELIAQIIMLAHSESNEIFEIFTEAIKHQNLEI